MPKTSIHLPPATFSAIEAQLTLSAEYRRKSQDAEFAAQALLREYCEALGFPPGSQYEYRPGDRGVTVVTSEELQPTTQPLADVTQTT